MADLQTNPDVMEEYAKTLDGLHSAIDGIREYTHTTACDKSGFTGVFVVLQPVIDMLNSLFDDTLKFGHDRLSALSEGVSSSAKAYSDHEDLVTNKLQSILDELDQGGTTPAAGDPGSGTVGIAPNARGMGNQNPGPGRDTGSSGGGGDDLGPAATEPGSGTVGIAPNARDLDNQDPGASDPGGSGSTENSPVY